MCGRYTAAKDFGELIKLVGVIMARVPFFSPRYNIAPTQMIQVVLEADGARSVTMMRWGFRPPWKQAGKPDPAPLQLALDLCGAVRPRDAIYVGERNSSPYGCLKLAGSMFAVFARDGVAKMLADASALLPRAHMLLVWDAYRPLAVQQALFDSYVSELEGRGVAHDQAIVDAQRFVSIPTTDQTKPPPHNTGGSVDLTIIRFNETDWREMERLAKDSRVFDQDGDWKGVYASEMRRQQLIREASTPLAMGTPFDGVQQETATRFYEDADITSLDDVSRQRLLNRRLLCNAMTGAGFSNYPDEWWHYDFGNQFDAARTGKKAIYGAISLSTENEAWEKIRRGHYLGNITIANRQHVPEQVGKLGLSALYTFVRDLVRTTGNMGYTTHSQAAGL